MVQDGYPDWKADDYVVCPKECSCQLPFIYNEKIIDHCIYDNSYRPWCSTFIQYNDSSHNWIYCEEKCKPNPCQDNSQCVNLGDSYKCLVKNGTFI